MSKKVPQAHNEYMREYRKTDKNKKYMHDYRQRRKQAGILQKQKKAWRQTDSGKKCTRASCSRYRLRNKQKKYAQGLAVKHLSIEGKSCELCPEEDKLPAEQRHHPDYNYPLIVVLTCKQCHEWIKVPLNSSEQIPIFGEI